MIKRNLRNTSTNVGQLPYLTSSGFVATIVTGSISLFQQTTAPVGWTKLTAHDNKALRVVSGTASSGGTTAFSTVFTNRPLSFGASTLSGVATTLSTTQIPLHVHGVGGGAVRPDDGRFQPNRFDKSFPGSAITSSSTTGSGASHTHSISGTPASSNLTLAVQYVDLILAQKN
jgi:hypothetical protein